MYLIKGYGVVWDPDTNAPLATFVDGLHKTEDAKLAEKLKALGYSVESSVSEKKASKKED